MRARMTANSGVTVSLLVILVITSSVPAANAYTCAPSMAPDQAAANTELQNSYNSWKATHVTSSGAGGFLRVRGDNNNTFSEGIGYGMVLSAYMNDRAIFDSLWNYAKSHFDSNGLMHWRIDGNNNVTGFNAATDGDEDMALALIVADKKWGGYSNDARTLINNIMTHEVEPNTFVLKPGDVWGGSGDTNPSYFAPAYYKVFKAYTGDANWDRVVDKCYAIIANVNAKTGAGTTGLQPGWCTAAGDPVAGRPSSDFDYEYNACRVPWRLAKDAAWYCDGRAKSQLDKLNAFFKGIGAANIKDGYALDGRLTGQWHIAAFVAPAAAGAITSTDATYKTSMWNEAVRLTGGGYYHDSLRVLAILFMSGNMYNPMDDANKLVLDDFESGSTSKWSIFKDAGTTITKSVVSPGMLGAYAMKVQYSIVSWGGVSQGFSTWQNWSNYQTFDFRFNGSNTGNTIRLEVLENRAQGSSSDTSERFEYKFTDDFTGWRHFVLPWAAFQRRVDWQPSGAPNDGFTVTEVWGFSFAPLSGAGSFQIDQVELVKKTYSILDDFESGNTSKWSAFQDPGSTVSPTVVSPGKIGNYAMSVQYNIVLWGGVSQGYSGPRDWGSYKAIEFWFYGNGSGNTIRLEVSDNRASGSTTDTAERFEYKFVDNSTGWKYFSVPWGSFSRRADWQPTGAPNDGFTRTQIWGFNFSPLSGTGNFQLDQVQLMK